MENKQFPEQKETGFVPEEPAETPAPPEEPIAQELPVEELPVEELPVEELPAEEVPAEEIPLAEEEPAAEVIPAADEIPAVETPAAVEENPITRPISDETMVDEATLREIQAAVAHEMLSHPQVGQEITPDEHAMAQHDMKAHDEPELASNMPGWGAPQQESPAQEELPLPEAPSVDQEYRDSGEDFQEMFNAPAEENPIPSYDRPTRKGRPKRRRGEFLFGLPGIAATVIWLAIILTVGVTLGRMLWACASDVLAFGRADKTVTVTVYQSDTIDDITEKLHKGGLIRYPGLFKLYASLAVDEGEIKPGVWDLNTLYDYHALVSMMSRSSTYEVVQVMIPEGYTCSQIFALLEENKVCTAQDLADWAANGELDNYWFLEGVERGTENCLEGFLFPDTYEFYKNESARTALQRMLDNFGIRFSEEMRDQIAALNEELTAIMRANGRSEEFIAENQFTVREVVIVASLIEKETSGNEESPSIASVIYNRLFNWGDTPAYLNIDASIVYALGGKTELTAEDLRIDSPYNTYTNTGLTPGAISNPGLASIKAALEPADTNYYFYVLDPASGTHKFSSTLDEHNAFIASLE